MALERYPKTGPKILLLRMRMLQTWIESRQKSTGTGLEIYSDSLGTTALEGTYVRG